MNFFVVEPSFNLFIQKVFPKLNIYKIETLWRFLYSNENNDSVSGLEISKRFLDVINANRERVCAMRMRGRHKSYIWIGSGRATR